APSPTRPALPASFLLLGVLLVGVLLLVLLLLLVVGLLLLVGLRLGWIAAGDGVFHLLDGALGLGRRRGRQVGEAGGQPLDEGVADDAEHRRQHLGLGGRDPPLDGDG